jgi:glutamate-1-semialdehyde 2,1-aminomutase
METSLVLYAGGAAALATALKAALARLQLTRAKLPTLTGHVRIAQRLARLIPHYEYNEDRFYSVDGAPEAVVAQRREGFAALARLYSERFAETTRFTTEAERVLSDLQFTGSYRVPFPFTRLVRKHLPSAGFAASSAGVFITDLDGNVSYDLTGSYGVNLLGHDFYKDCIRRGSERVQGLGPVPGALHRVTLANARDLQRISCLDEVSFHMSGTEAVMQAVRLARYHTGRALLVRFAGAYHGWWGDVQPGVGNPRPAHETLTLKDMAETSLAVLARRRDIACVLVNPLQALHPNASAPGDSALLDGRRRAHVDRVAYTVWLHKLRAVCTERRIVLIFDEVFTGFRLAQGGAQEYFGVAADLVTYGKTVGGGLPVGVVCGRKDLMKRFADDRPADICFARGTFNSHPYVMGAMREFLDALAAPAIDRLYNTLDDLWDRRARQLNQRLAEAALPVYVTNLSTIWTVGFDLPSRYHWMFQYYLRAEGLTLSWVGTGRIIFSLNYSDAEFDAVADRFIRAAAAMRADGWWWTAPDITYRSIRRTIVNEMIRERCKGLVKRVT